MLRERPIKGEKRDLLHVIDEDIAMQYLSSKRIKRQRLALATRPHDSFFLCIIPSQNTNNSWNETNLMPVGEHRHMDSGLARGMRASMLTRSMARDARCVSGAHMADAFTLEPDRGHLSTARALRLATHIRH